MHDQNRQHLLQVRRPLTGHCVPRKSTLLLPENIWRAVIAGRICVHQSVNVPSPVRELRKVVCIHATSSVHTRDRVWIQSPGHRIDISEPWPHVSRDRPPGTGQRPDEPSTLQVHRHVRRRQPVSRTGLSIDSKRANELQDCIGASGKVPQHSHTNLQRERESPSVSSEQEQNIGAD